MGSRMMDGLMDKSEGAVMLDSEGEDGCGLTMDDENLAEVEFV